MNEQERMQRMEILSRDVFHVARNTLLLNLRFLDSALSRLDYTPDLTVEFATDGDTILYNPGYVLSRFVKDKKYITRDYLHVLLHCIFRHMYVHSLVDHRCWDLACDIAVEYSISQMNLDVVSTGREAEQAAVFQELLENHIPMTAEKLYRIFLDQDYTDEELEYFRELFYVDDHIVWYISHESKNDVGNSSDNDDSNESENDSENSNGNGSGDNPEDGDNSEQAAGAEGNEESDDADESQSLSAEQDWKNVSERLQMELETFAKQQGEHAGALVQNLASVNREKYDYAGFLRKFAVLGEVMQINDDEFDYVYYTYGLRLYQNMPLVEPLEYKEVKRIREFVIAIDTSGSTSGELVQTFLNKTYNILKASENFFRKINIHIIQCDATIQEDARITCQEDFDDYLKTMQLHGMGGTDFRPVFQYVEKLRQGKEFSNLKGLIYFTDGYGTFPEQRPDYETAFVFIDDEYNNPEIPPWAIKLILSREEI